MGNVPARHLRWTAPHRAAAGGDVIVAVAMVGAVAMVMAQVRRREHQPLVGENLTATAGNDFKTNGRAE